jgi:serine/threonine protein phosphatase PrpC
MASQPANPRIKHRSAMLTDVGVIREHNEDSAHVDPRGDFFIVADGMGGHAAGEVASAMAVEAVAAALTAARADLDAFAAAPTETGRKGLVALLEAAVRSAHQAVFDRGSKETDKHGMGTTLDVVLLASDEAFVAHVGDSRTYLVREGKASQITTDHTVAEVLVIEGKLSAEEAQVSPLRTILVNAIGVAAEVGVEMAHVKLRKGDIILLCSDGLHDYYPTEQELAGVLTGATPEDALVKLIGSAKSRGGHDNITGVVIEVLELPSAELAAADTGEIVADNEADAVPRAVNRDDTVPVSSASVGAAVTAPVAAAKPSGRAGSSTDPMPSGTIPPRPAKAKDRGEDEGTVPLERISAAEAAARIGTAEATEAKADGEAGKRKSGGKSDD